MRVISTSLRTAAALAAAVLIGIVATSLGANALAGQEHIVKIRNVAFVPAELIVAPGDTIIWINEDVIPHTVTANDESWDSGLISVGDRWQTQVQAGMYAGYFCRYHPSMTAQMQIVQK